MTGFIGLRLLQWTGIGKPGPSPARPTGAAFSKVGDAGAFCAESVEIAFIETHLSRGFRWYA
jgi:hypothetical protein